MSEIIVLDDLLESFVRIHTKDHDRIVELLNEVTALNSGRGWDVQGPTRTDKFLHWIADRLIHVHGESENVDYVIRLRAMAEAYTKRMT